MCDHAHYEGLRDDIELLKSDVKEMNERVTMLESGIGEMRLDVKNGFDNVTADMRDIRHGMLDEKAKWNDTIRKWVSWVIGTGLVIITVACGVEQLPQIVSIFK